MADGCGFGVCSICQQVNIEEERQILVMFHFVRCYDSTSHVREEVGLLINT